jgi:hypothetical protein
MSRDSGGNYTLPNAAFVSGTVISSSVMNSNFTDLSSEITNSLDRNGKGGMLARLRGVDGTSALPAYAFTSETTLGFYRSASNDLRASSNGTDIMKWSSTAITLYQAFTAEKGGTITQSTANTAGLTVTGNGTAAGAVVTGGSSAGNGLTITGGAGNGVGAVIAGGSTGRGATISAGGGNNTGVTVTGAGTGVGGAFTGGATGDGLTATGGGSGKTGGVFTGGAGGAGAIGIPGTAATATTRQTALAAQSGDIAFTSVTNPNSDVAFTNTVSPKNITKAWASITFGGGGLSDVTLNDGFNIASVSSIDNIKYTVTITFGSAFANANFVVSGSCGMSAGGSYRHLGVRARTTTTVEVAVLDAAAGTPVFIDANAAVLMVSCTGAQT